MLSFDPLRRLWRDPAPLFSPGISASKQWQGRGEVRSQKTLCALDEPFLGFSFSSVRQGYGVMTNPVT